MPEAWNHCSLADVVTLQRGLDLPEYGRRRGNVPVLGSFGVTGWHDEAAVVGPGVTIGRSGGSIGVTTYTASRYWPLNTTLFVRDFHGNDPRFVYYLLGSYDFAAYDSGSAQPSLNRNFIARMPVLLPPLSEQCAIAEVLGAFDDKIEVNERATSIAKTWVVAAYSSAGEGLVPLSAIARSRHTTVDPSSLGETLVDHFSLPAFDAGQRPERTEATSIKSNKLQVPPSSVLMSRLNPRIQRVWRAQVDGEVPALSSTEFLVLQPVDGLTATDIWAVCSDAVVSAEMAARVTGTSGSHQRVRPQDAMSVEAPDPRVVPSQVRQCAEAMLTLVDSLDVEAALLAQLRDVLLPRLLSGELRVRDAAAIVEEAV
jgi:type I restriction enzyme S subunit